MNAAKAIKLAQMTMKHYYNHKHEPKFFDVSDEVMLWLYQEYEIPIIMNHKLAQQYAGRFKILERIRRLTYRLELPSHWEIHPIISITHLEPVKSDIFNHP